MSIAWALAAAVLFFGVAVFWWGRKGRARDNIPSVPGAFPVLGHLPYIGLSALVAKCEEWADLYGESGAFRINLAGVSTVVVCSYDGVMELFGQRPYKVTRSKKIASAVDSIGACGLFSAEGESWRHDRRMLAPAFNHAHNTQYLPLIQRISTRLRDKWQHHCSDAPGVSLAINKDLLSTALDTVSLLTLDYDVDSLRAAATSSLAHDIMRVFEVCFSRAMLPIYKLPWGKELDGGGSISRRLAAFMGGIVDQKSKVARSERSQRERTTSLITKIIEASVDEKKPLQRDRVIGNLSTAFFAGTDTTGHTLAWMLWRLATGSPAQQEALAAEAASTDVLAEGSKADEVLASLPLTRCLFFETLRLHGPAPFLALESAEPVTLLGNTLPKGTVFYALCGYLGKSPKADPGAHGIPGSQPEAFDLYRWLADDGSVVDATRESKAFLAFGHGLRRCPGKELAQLEAVTCIATLLRTFHVTPMVAHPPVGSKTAFTECPDHDMHVVLTPR